MKNEINHILKHHKSQNKIFNSYRQLIEYNEIFDEYYLKSGRHAIQCLSYCPFCGIKFPESKRDLFFDTLEELGFDTDISSFKTDPKIPERFKSSEWWVNGMLEK